MFADVGVCAGQLVLVVALEARVREVLLIQAPAYTLVFEKVDDRLDARVEAPEVVVGDAVLACTGNGDVVGLRRVGAGEIVRQ